MNIIISFAGLENKHSATPYPLRHIAGSTILGHILVHLLDLPFSQLILILSSGEEQVQEWIKNNLPDLALRIRLVHGSESPVAALTGCNDLLDSQPVLFIAGNYISEAKYLALTNPPSDASCLLQSEQDDIEAEALRIDPAGLVKHDGDLLVRWSGACWFKRGSDLVQALEQVGSRPHIGLEPILSAFTARGLQVSTQLAVYCLDTQSVDSLLYANSRLLRLNYGSQDAIERSYAEDFSVLPPVFLHETAVIENSVIGPFVNLEANASISNSIVSNSLIGKDAQLKNVVLDRSLIGDSAIVTGQKRSLIVNDDDKVELDAEQS